MKRLEEYVRGRVFRERLEVYKSIRSGRLRVEDPNPPVDYYDYLTRPAYSAWLWTGLILAGLTLASILLSSLNVMFVYLRYILGSIFVLFLPGFFTVETLYPSEGELSDLERLALSIGLSLAITPLIGLALNYTPWGIRLTPVVASLSIYSVVMAFTASYRKYILVYKALRLRGRPTYAGGKT